MIRSEHLNRQRALQRLGSLSLALSASLASCTAVHWSGSDGKDRHAGLVLVEVDQLPAGRRARIMAFGLVLDLRRGGRSYSIGFTKQAITTPQLVGAADWPEFLCAFEAAAAGTAPRDDCARIETAPLWGTTKTEATSHLFESTLGLAVGDGRQGWLVRLGYAARTRFSLPTAGAPMAWVANDRLREYRLIQFVSPVDAPTP